MTFNGATDGTLRYNIVASPEPGGVLLSVVLSSTLPASLAGKARFNLEFIPSRYENKTFQVDTTGDKIDEACTNSDHLLPGRKDRKKKCQHEYLRQG